MAQLRYSKAIACGTAVTVGLVGAYLYKNITSRNALNKKLGDLTDDEDKSHHHCKETCTARCECGKTEKAEDIVATAKVSPLGGGDSDVDNPSSAGRSSCEKDSIDPGKKKRDKGSGDSAKKGGKDIKTETAKKAGKKDTGNVDPDKKGSPESRKTSKKNGRKSEDPDKKDGPVDNKKSTKKDRNTENVKADKQGRDSEPTRKPERKGKERGDAKSSQTSLDSIASDNEGKGVASPGSMSPDGSGNKEDFLRQTMEDFEEFMFSSEKKLPEMSSVPVPVEESVVLQSLNEAATESSAPWYESRGEGTVLPAAEDEVFTAGTAPIVNGHAESAVDPVDVPPAITDSLQAEVKGAEAPVENGKGKTLVNGSNGSGHHDSSMVGSDGGSEANSDGSASDSGRGSSDTSSVGKDQASSPELPPMPILYQFEFPSDLCGRLIGKQGRNIKELRDKTGAKIFLKPLAVTTKYQLCIVDGLPKSIERALEVIKRRFPEVDTSRQSLTADAQGMNVKMPSISQLQLPDEGVNNIILTSVVSAGHVFLQQPGQTSFSALNRLNNCMNNCYCQTDRVPPLPQPIEVGIVCAAPVMDSWYRAQLVNYYQDENEADLRFLDYGGYARIDAGCLRQVRSDFLSLPFQAVECYLANIVPLQGESDFSEDARLFIEQIAQNYTLLQSKIVAYSMDGVPLIEIFYEEAENGNVHSVNRELVERSLAAWYEGVEEVAIEYPDEAYLVPVS